MILVTRKERTRFLKFATVGTMGAVIDFGIANGLISLFHMSLVYAGIVSFFCAVLSNFTWNRLWTYPESRSRHILHQLGMYVLVSLTGITMRIPILRYAALPILNIFLGIKGISANTAAFLARNTPLALADGIVMMWNFFVNRYWTYNDVE